MISALDLDGSHKMIIAIEFVRRRDAKADIVTTLDFVIAMMAMNNIVNHQKTFNYFNKIVIAINL